MQIDQVQYDQAVQSFFSWLISPVGLIVLVIVVALIIFLTVVNIMSS